jgi:hypothetical protein
MAANLTTACTRPATRWFSCYSTGTGGRVMPGVMPTMRRVFLTAVCFAALAPACSWAGNYERAYYIKRGATYFVELKGRRRLMAHDPFSALRGRTYEETLTLELPRIEGAVEGAEIPVRPGYLLYAGRVVITGRKMRVALYYEDRDGNAKVPLTWNGEYTLVQKGPTGMP